MSDLFSIYEDGLNIELNRLGKIIEKLPNLSKGKDELYRRTKRISFERC